MAYIETRTLKTGTTYRVRWRADGQQQTSPAYDTLKEAEDYRTLLEAEEIITGRPRNLSRSQTPFQDVAEKWFKLWSPTRGEATVKNKRSVLDAQLIPEFGTRPIGEITIDDVQAWVNESDAAPASVEKHYVTFGQVMRWAMKRDYLPRGLPVGAGIIDLPKGKRRKIFLDHDELDHLLAVAGQPRFAASAPLIHLEAHTGMRLAEILGLPRTAFRPKQRALRVAGTKSEASDRTIALDDCCVTMLQAQLSAHESPWIFPGPNGGKQNGSNWRKRVWYPLRDAAGFKDMGLHFHDLRHTHASHLLAAGWEVTAVAERLGHTPKVLLQVYGHVTSKDRQSNLIALKGMRST